MTKINPITLSIEKETWDKFCELVPDTRTKNGTIIELIESHIKKEGEKNEETNGDIGVKETQR